MYPTYIPNIYNLCCPTYISVTQFRCTPTGTPDIYDMLPNIYRHVPDLEGIYMLGHTIYTLGAYMLGNIYMLDDIKTIYVG